MFKPVLPEQIPSPQSKGKSPHKFQILFLRHSSRTNFPVGTSVFLGDFSDMRVVSRFSRRWRES